ncbi:AI-2E family transporter [sulfur-oxidizing endosymbiont of Gigantopelta aegis]|uniref:AI-2E family transporter n=1 Tax=sulfur-oxidizing endosymbiont of Gigantopelta aegis TaxID=2794934 RepID=UPI0018DECEB6|nr:AI-2E family transporter [sulfur-oxidizing endosymbiont of Gigantopelta aegis]
MTTKNSSPIEIAIQISLIAILSLWCFQIAKPFISIIVWAGIIAIGTYPIFLWLKKKVGLKAGWTATIITLTLLVILITPTILISSALIDNTQTLSQHIKNDQLVIPAPPEGVADWPLVGEKLNTIWSQAAQDPKALIGQYKTEIKTLMKWGVSAAAGAGLNILVFVISIIIAGVFLVSGKGIKNVFINIFNRVADGRGNELTTLSLSTVNSVVTGILGIALIQSLLAGMGFIAMDIPAAGVLAFICLIMAIVQIDILLVLIPISIYTFTDETTGTVAAVTFLVWNIAVGLLNNVLKPILLAKGVDAPMAIIFIGAIGGMILSGIVGLFIGAVVMVLGYTLFMVWLKPETIKS